MRSRRIFQQLDLYLIRVLDTLLREQSVTRTAQLLETSQPSISDSLRRLRDITDDALFVRHGQKMVPTDFAQSLAQPASDMLLIAEQAFFADRLFDAANSENQFRIAAPDYLDPRFIPTIIQTVRRLAPNTQIDVRPLTAEFDYQAHLANGALDLAIGNWPEVPLALHRGPLIDDEVVCLVSAEHPAVRRGWSVKQWLSADHVAPTAMVAGERGVIDEHLHRRGMTRHIVARAPHFGVIPASVAGSNLVLTTGRLFCEQFASNELAILPCPVRLPKLNYYLLWHQRSHQNPAQRWLRGQIGELARRLSQHRSTNLSPEKH